MGKLLKFPEQDITVLRNCGVCGREMQVPTSCDDVEDMVCFRCFLWEKVEAGDMEGLTSFMLGEEE